MTDHLTSNLLPCPFCGASESTRVWIERFSICTYAVRCDCGIQGPTVEEMRFEVDERAAHRAARKAWNTRATPPPPASPPTAPLWLAQAFEGRAKHERNCAWSSEAGLCTCGLFELRLHLANVLRDAETKKERCPHGYELANLRDGTDTCAGCAVEKSVVEGK